ncbi:MAG: elongation factor Ts [Rhodospirillales bacterium]|nr:elongation factor Ts [Rhodospirillales bacterium]
MAEITSALVKELRDKTGAGMMDCKKALTESGGALERAVDWLRTKGLATAAKKAGRIASEGLVAVAVKGSRGALVEVNAETDFVGRNEAFQAFVRDVAHVALAAGADVDKIKAAPYPGTGRSAGEQLTHLIATIGENMNLRRASVISVDKGAIASYMHSALAPGIGKIGVLVALESAADPKKLETLGKQIAMHVAAARPESVSKDDLDPASIERERNVLAEQARSSGKPPEIIAKMVEGRLRKFYEEVCLVDQTYAIDGESKVGAVLQKAAKELGAPVNVKAFAVFKLGEGIEKAQKDFASEVAAARGA